MKPSQIIKEKLMQSNGTSKIPLQKTNSNGKDYFTVTLSTNGVEVDNLGTQPFLSWELFDNIYAFLTNCGGELIKGNAVNGKLGDDKLPLKSVEGYIAYSFYNKQKGDSVFRRVTPVCALLEWTGLCENKRGYIKTK